MRTTCASKILGDFIPPFDATVVERLRAAGAVFVGKANLDEFAMGSSTENSAFGPTRNPHDLERVAGGSSGGSAAAVAADECLASLGTDTGGSIRQPASFCGVVGIKPTYSRVSRYGVIAYASSLDQVGPFARSVRDAAISAARCRRRRPARFDLLGAAGTRLRTRTNGRGARDAYRRAEGILRRRDGRRRSKPRCAVRSKQLEAMGARTVEISLPHTGYAVAAYYLIATAEASANLSRYDGIRYGMRAAADNNIELYNRTRAQGFGAEVKRRIMLGTFALSAGYYDAYYLKGQKVRTLIRRDFERAFESCDLIVAPVAPTTAFQARRKNRRPAQDVSVRHFHHLGEPRRAARDVGAVRRRRVADCRSDCN